MFYLRNCHDHHQMAEIAPIPTPPLDRKAFDRHQIALRHNTTTCPPLKLTTAPTELHHISECNDIVGRVLRLAILLQMTDLAALVARPCLTPITLLVIV